MMIIMIMVTMIMGDYKLQRSSLNSMQLKLGFYSDSSILELNFQDRTSTIRNETVTHSMANSMIELG